MGILITGAAGQLGSEITALLKSRGETPSCFDRELDISDYTALMRAVEAHKPSLIINCAAYNDVEMAETRWEDANLANGIGPKNLAMAAEHTGAALVHFSTDYVFDGRTTRPYTVNDLPNPISAYGQSKLMGEELLMEHTRRAYLIRTSWLFGRGAHSFPLKVLGWASRSKEISVVDDQTASPTYARDLAEATLDLAATGKFGLYHITNSGQCSRYEWAEYILQSRGWDGTLIRAKSGDFKTQAERPAFSVLDNFPIENTIGRTLPTWQDATSRLLQSIDRDI